MHPKGIRTPMRISRKLLPKIAIRKWPIKLRIGRKMEIIMRRSRELSSAEKTVLFMMYLSTRTSSRPTSCPATRSSLWTSLTSRGPRCSPRVSRTSQDSNSHRKTQELKSSLNLIFQEATTTLGSSNNNINSRSSSLMSLTLREI